VREAVMQMILHVARQFPIIRFDAAMTLAKKHYQRLWFPQPGTGGAIPSRAEHGLTRQQLDQLIPEEFWRQVVDRVAAEVPDTLLLAEAFWLMEGYFVRTLGMHRVYNSAFMNMLRDEDNAKYRSVIKKTLEFDPRILKRYVNFMNNPDERTAVDQFGKGDKYFGICTLLATMPGLPMFGHGQIEGYTEKYGMEYRRAYWDERPDPHLVARHEREISPLLHRRYLFAGVENFRLYDFFAPEGHVNEDVFAYSNRVGGEKALVVYHNKYAAARGWIRASVAYSVKSEDGGQRLEQKSLGAGLALEDSGETYTIFRDQLTGLEYIRNNRELHERGLYAELGAYKCHVFLDFRQLQDNEWHQYAQLAAYLNGRGVPSIDEALKEVLLQPVHHPFRELVNAEVLRRIALAEQQKERDALVDEAGAKMMQLLQEIKAIAAPDTSTALSAGASTALSGDTDEAAIVATTAGDVQRELRALWQTARVEGQASLADPVSKVLREMLADDHEAWYTLCGWLFTHALGKVVSETDFAQVSRSWIDEWLLGRIIASALQDLGLDEGSAWWAVSTIKILITHQRWFEMHDAGEDRAYQALRSWLQDEEVQRFLQVNRYQDVLWFNEEAFDQLLWWMLATATITISANPMLSADETEEEILTCYAVVRQLQEAKQASGYRVERLLEIVRA
jgi:hypothetical protein